MAVKQKEIAKGDIDYQKSSLLPKVNGFINYGTSNQTEFDALLKEANYNGTIGLNVSWELFDWGQTKDDIKKSEKMNEQKIPIIGSNEVYTNLGGLISQGTTDYQIGYRAGEMAVEILKNGKKPSDIKIESVQKPTISVNKANMELLGIKLPESILSKAEIK